MSDTPLCRICQQEMNLESAAIQRCERCDTPFHYVCWVYNDRLCAVYGCEKTSVEEEEERVREEAGGWSGEEAMRTVVVVMSGCFVLFFLIMAMEACNRAP